MLLPVVVEVESGDVEGHAVVLHGTVLLHAGQEAGGEDGQVELGQGADEEGAVALVLALPVVNVGDAVAGLRKKICR